MIKCCINQQLVATGKFRKVCSGCDSVFSVSLSGAWTNNPKLRLRAASKGLKKLSEF